MIPSNGAPGHGRSAGGMDVPFGRTASVSVVPHSMTNDSGYLCGPTLRYCGRGHSQGLTQIKGRGKNFPEDR